MVVNRDNHMKDMADQKISNRKMHEIISKEEDYEFLLEANNAFIQYASRKVNSVDSSDLKCVTIRL